MPNLEDMLERRNALEENITGYRLTLDITTDILTAQTKPLALGYRSASERHKIDAMTVYARAGRPGLGFLLLGRNASAEGDRRFSTPEYPLMDAAVYRNFGVLNQLDKNRGSVLSSPTWSMLLNDLFMSGAVANRVPFYLASNRKFSTMWDAGERHATIYARELAGLFMAGYELTRLPDGSEAMLPPAERTIPLALSTYIGQLPAYINKAAIAAMGEPNLTRLLYNSRNEGVIRIRFFV